MKLTELQRKVLTEFLGEYGHSYTVGFRTGGRSKCSCGRKGCSVLDFCQHENRTFLTWSDLGAVKDKLMERGLINDFYAFSFEIFIKESNQRHYNEEVDGLGVFFTWLFRPIDGFGEPHFCRLVAEFLEERK